MQFAPEAGGFITQLYQLFVTQVKEAGHTAVGYLVKVISQYLARLVPGCGGYAFPLFRSMGSFGTDAEKPLARPGIQVSLSHFAGIFSLLLQELAGFLVGIIGIRQRIGLHGCHQFLLFGDDFVKHRHIAFITLLCLLVTSFGTLAAPIRTEKAAQCLDKTAGCIHHAAYHAADVTRKHGVRKLADTFRHGIETLYHPLGILVHRHSEPFQHTDDIIGRLCVG